jgi:hypothetical protein
VVDLVVEDEESEEPEVVVEEVSADLDESVDVSDAVVESDEVESVDVSAVVPGPLMVIEPTPLGRCSNGTWVPFSVTVTAELSLASIVISPVTV